MSRPLMRAGDGQASGWVRLVVVAVAAVGVAAGADLVRAGLIRDGGRAWWGS